MAGAKHTNRHLQRLMLRGLLLPAAAAGVIVLGASAASADEDPAGISPESVASDVQSSVEAAGTSGTSTVDGALSVTHVDTSSAGGDQPAVGNPSVDEGRVGPPTEPRSMPAAGSAIEPPTPSPARQPSSGPGSGGSAVTPAEPVAESATESVAGSATESVTSTVETAPAPNGQDAAGPATRLADATEVAGTLRETVPEPSAVKPVAAPAPDPLSGTLTEPVREVTPTFDAVTQAIKQDSDPLVGRITEPLGETTPVFDRLLDEAATAPDRTVEQTSALGGRLLDKATEPAQAVIPVLDAATSLPGQALAPAVATMPVFTGVTDGLLADIGGAGALLTGLTDQVTTPLLPSTDTVLGQIAAPLLASTLSDEVTPLTSILAGPESSPAATAATPTRPEWPTWSPTTTTSELPTAETSGWAAGWTPAYDVEGSTNPASASPVPTVVALPAGSVLIGDEARTAGTSGLEARTVGTLSSLSLLGSEPTAAEAAGTGASGPPPSPDRNLLSQVGGLVEAVTATGGGTQGASGSVLLLLLAVFGAALLRRVDGLAQLTPGTATALSSRSALVQDRPG